MKFFNAMRASLLAFTVVFLFAPVGVFAQDEYCDDYTDNGKRIKCKHSKLITKQGDLIEKLGVHFGGLIDPDELYELKNAHKRAKSAKDRTPEKEYSKIGKKAPEPCQFKEYPDSKADGDGICETGERCLEIDDDDIGNNDSICKLRGNRAEVCECVEGSNEELLDDNVDLAYQRDVEESLEDMTAKLERANMVIEDESQVLAAMSRNLFDTNPAVNPCEASANWHKYAEVLTMTIMKQVATGLRATTDIMERGCDQTAAGFNLQAGCIIMEGVTGVMMVTVDTMEGIFKLADWYNEATKNTCLMSVYEDLQASKVTLNGIKAVVGGPPDPPIVGGLGQGLSDLLTDMKAVKGDVEFIKTEVGNISTQITELEAVMTTRFGEMGDILLTPHGRR
jgi:uncharacterized protein YejL (UPF0352 family)